MEAMHELERALFPEVSEDHSKHGRQLEPERPTQDEWEVRHATTIICCRLSMPDLDLQGQGCMGGEGTKTPCVT